MSHILEELLHGVLHFDSKAWRTLPLLVFRPGRLTRDYIDGKRARYIAPLAIFLFSVFLMYFAFALVGGPALGVNDAAVDEAAIPRSEERRVGKECVRTCRSRWSPDN